MPIQRFLNILPQKPDSDITEIKSNEHDPDSVNNFAKNNNAVTNDGKLSEEQFKKIIDESDEIDNFEPYILICKQTAHANHIKRLIVATGQKLLTTLNL